MRAREITLIAVLTALCVFFNLICSHTLPLHAGTALVVLSGIAMGPRNGAIVGLVARLICNFFDGQGPWTLWQMFAWALIGFLAGLAFNRVVLKIKIPGKKESLAKRLSLEKDRSYKSTLAPIVCSVAAIIVAYLVTVIFEGKLTEFVGWKIYVFGLLGLALGVIFQRKKLPANPVYMAVFTFFVVLLIYGGIMNFATVFITYISSGDENFSLETIKLAYYTGFFYDCSHAFFASVCIFFFGDSILQKIERVQIKFGITASGKTQKF